MKRFLLLVLSLLIVASCSEFDDSLIQEKLKNHEERISMLETLCKQMNTNISSLQTIVSALQNNDYVTNVAPITENGTSIGYTLTFSKSGSITIYNGTDGVTPVIGLKKDSYDVYCWTLNGDWLHDDSGNRIPAVGSDGDTGNDGITPKLKIDGGYWYVSYDNGGSWNSLGKAVGEDGEDGDTYFSDVRETSDAVILTLATGETITLAKLGCFDVTFETLNDILCDAGSTVSIPFSITGSVEKITLNCIGENGWKAAASMTSGTTGLVTVTVPDPVVDGQVLVFISNEKHQTIVKALTFEEKVLKSITEVYQIDSRGGNVQVEVCCNIDYSVNIPDEDKSWCSLVDTKAVRIDMLTFRISENEGTSDRSTEIDIVSEDDTKSFTITVYQGGTNSVIVFAEPVMKSYCVTAFDTDGDGELSYAEAAAVTDLSIMGRPYDAVSFDEFQYFTAVTSIGNHAFAHCRNLTSITIPESVTSIGFLAFFECTGLTSIVIPEGVTSIGAGAFSGCTGLTNITIPSSVTSIGESAFYGCTGLTNITIPSSVTSIGVSPAGGCDNLIRISVAEGNPVYDSRNDCNAIIETATNTLIQGCTTSAIPESVTSIGESAFYGCTGLTNITIPSSVTSIGDSAFYWCSGLTSITIPESVTSIGDSAFYGCSGLTSITIPESVTSMGVKAFEYSGLTNVHITSGVTSIGDLAFARCRNLTSITIPESVTSIGVSPARGCDNLIRISVAEGNPVYDSRNDCNAIIETATNTLIQGCTTSAIPESVTSIGDVAFYECTGLTNITIPSSVTSICYHAFWGCTGLTSITIPESVTSIGESAFSGCSGLTSIVIPEGVTSIGAGAFSGCNGLTQIYIEVTTPPTLAAYYGIGIGDSVRIYVPFESVDLYISDWRRYADKIVGYDFEHNEVVQ